MKLGISSYTYTWSLGIKGYEYEPVLDVYQLIDKTKQHGLNLLQIADNLPLHKFDKSELNRIAEYAKNKHVHIEVGTKYLTEENLKLYIGIAEIFNSKLLRFVIDDAADSKFAKIDDVIKICKTVNKKLQSNDITLAIENHDRLRAHEFESIILGINSDRVGICLDCANSLGAGEGIFETVNILAPYTVNLHLKDIRISRKKHMMGFDINGVPFGKGDIPLPWVISKMTDKCKTAILELWVSPEDKMSKTFQKEEEWVRRSIGYLLPDNKNSLLKKHNNNV